jgi:phosphohistidine phosphatase SixA
VRVDTVPALYSAGLGGYQSALASVTDADVAMTVAHEPTASGFAQWLANESSDRDAIASIAFGLVTSGAAVLELDSWQDVQQGRARLIAVLSGKS